jgi:hypothetical protein
MGGHVGVLTIEIGLVPVWTADVNQNRGIAFASDAR